MKHVNSSTSNATMTTSSSNNSSSSSNNNSDNGDTDGGRRENDATAEEKVHEEVERLLLDPRASVAEKLDLATSIEPPDVPYVRMVEGSRASFSEPLDWNVHFRKACTVMMWIRPVCDGDAARKKKTDNEGCTDKDEEEDNGNDDNNKGVGTSEKKDGGDETEKKGSDRGGKSKTPSTTTTDGTEIITDDTENNNDNSNEDEKYDNIEDDDEKAKNDKQNDRNNNNDKKDDSHGDVVAVTKPSILYRIGIKSDSYRGGGSSVVDGREKKKKQTAKDSSSSSEGSSSSSSSSSNNSKRKQFSSLGNGYASGVDVCFSPWILQDDGRTVQTSLTAVATTTNTNNNGNDDNNHSGEIVPCPPIHLDLRSWSLVSMTHVFPYLKRPTWTLAINGQEIFTGEMPYPELTPPLLLGGGGQHSGGAPGDPAPVLDWEFLQIRNAGTSVDWHGLALYSQPLSCHIQALAAATGISGGNQYPQFYSNSQPVTDFPTTFANLLPRIPPTPNWSKGSTMDGSPKVGIPLIVHPLANELQHVSDAAFVIGANADVAIARSNKQFIFPCTTKVPGTTSSVPKVGLLQPTPTNHSGSNQSTQYHNCTFTITNQTMPIDRKPDTRISVLTMQDYSLSRVVLPFFLAQGPPRGCNVLSKKRQEKYEEASLGHLKTLFSRDSALAIGLVDVLTSWIERGGPRAHEQVLQEGLIHILSVTLRKNLIRAQKSLTGHENNTNEGPNYIPTSLTEALSRLIQACCGGWDRNQSYDKVSPSMKIRRASDLAMAALFGFGLDFDLWGSHAKSANIILRPIATMYGSSIQTGTMIRNQVSVQFFLDQIRLTSWNQQEEAEGVAERLSHLLQAMLLSSLSNRRSISQGENDVSACLGALSDCSLGGVGAHVILTALIRILHWCEIYPETRSTTSIRETNEDAKMQVAMRLGRNLLMGQFHDVVAPMLLSRTVLSGDQQEYRRTSSSPPSALLSWKHHWRLSLMIFSWVASIAGPEGEVASKSSGSLLLASGLAGSLKGALQDAEPKMVTYLFLPPPRASSSSRKGGDEPKYVDALSDRLEVMMPLLPGMVVSLLSHPTDSTFDTVIPPPSVAVLSELCDAVSGAFRRVFGGSDFSAPLIGKRATVKQKQRKEKILGVIRAADTYVPHLLVVVMLLESHIQLRRKKQRADENSVINILSPPPPTTTTPPSAESETDKPDANDSKDSWVEVGEPNGPSMDNNRAVEFTDEGDMSEREVLLSRLEACQDGIMSTLCELVLSTMVLGGGETTTALLRSILLKLKESGAYSATSGGPDGGGGNSGGGADSASSEELAQNILCRLVARVLINSLRRDSQWEVWTSELCSSVSKCCVLVEEKDLLVKPSGHVKAGDDGRDYSSDQIVLFCALLDIMSYGRDVTGWCQLILPNPPDSSAPSSSNDAKRQDSEEDATMATEDDSFRLNIFSRKSSRSTAPTDASSKLMLPVLQPCLRIVIGCFRNFSSEIRVAIPGDVVRQEMDTEESKKEDSLDSENNEAGEAGTASIVKKELSLLEHSMCELKPTLTAGIVGLSFPNARDIALGAMASLRRAVQHFRATNDEAGVDLCYSLLFTVTEEIRVRHEGERRRRETALFDAYDEEPTDAAREAAEASQVVENIMLGSDLLTTPAEDSAEEMTFQNDDDAAEESGEDNHPPLQPKTLSEDFVLFHEKYQDYEQVSTTDQLSETGGSAKLAWAQYDGLGVTLDECANTIKQSKTEDSSSSSCVMPEKVAEDVLSSLTPYLDAWDESAAVEAAESELVDLFDANMRIEAEAEATTTAAQGGGEKSVDHSTADKSSSSAGPQQLPLLGAESAADAMSTFIEFANVEKSRLADISATFLPSHRYSRVAYAERFCWARYIEMAGDSREFSMDGFWERGVHDGNRDVRSRIITVPCIPQFRRYIPKYLDHTADFHDSSHQNTMNDESESKRNDIGVSVRTENNIDSSEQEQDNIDEFTKTLLETGKLEIVDITKKEVAEEELEPNLDARDASNAPDDDGVLESFEDSRGGSDEPNNNKGSKTTTPSELSTEDASSSELKQSESSSLKTESGESASKGLASHHNVSSSPYATPPDNSSSSLSIIHSAAAGMVEQYMDNCLHVKAEGSRKCSMLLTSTHLILEYDVESEGLYEGELMAVQEEAERQKMCEDVGHSGSHDQEDIIHEQLERKQREQAALRQRSLRWNLSEVSHIYLRRYRLRDSSIELFFIPSGGASFGGFGVCAPSTSLFLDFGPGYEGNTRRDDAAFAIMKRTPPQALKQWPDRSVQFLHDQLSRLTIAWVEGRVTNFDYLLHLNMLAGRSYNDICQYPVMPWVLADYKSEEVPDLTDPENFRDLSKPMGALNPGRLEDFIERFNTFADPSIPPFMYGSHYSTSAGVVLHFLVRLHPFAGLHRQLQGGHFDVADRLFSSVPRTWDMCTGSSAAEVKELTPEWYCNPAFLKNTNNFKLGTSQDGDILNDVALPPWANGSPDKFVEVMRCALESEICSKMLPDWIDLIFGRKQQGPEAIKAHNVFFYLTYYGSIDVASIEDEALRHATELQIAHFGQCPMQLFSRPHVGRLPPEARFRNLTFYQLISSYTQKINESNKKEEKGKKIEGHTEDRVSVFGEAAFLSFLGAPLSHWVHLDAPPPGPHANLVAVRLAGTDRCLAVDSRGIFHCFRWAWKAEEKEGSTKAYGHNDHGCFVAQRELPRFRSVPRLLYTDRSDVVPPLAISKTLFAGGSVLLVLSDGDGRGGLGMQLIDPAKGSVRGEALVPSIHSARVTCIAADPIGTAAGHGGVGGELAIVGSADGTASLWRFMSSHYLPLRPRVKFQGHRGSKVCAVAISAAIQIVATVSKNRCCIFSVVNGTLLRYFSPPQDALELTGTGCTATTKFADCPALAISVQGFVVTVCETTIISRSSPRQNRTVITLQLFTLEGLPLGSKPLENWRGVPHKISSTPDGTAVLVCSGRGVTVHRLSAIAGLDFLDEWQVTEMDDLTTDSVPHAWDVDLGPNLPRPVVAATACSSGVLRLHALPGISAWSERHRKPGLSNPFAMPAKKFTSAMREGFGIGSKVVGMGKEITKEVSSDVKERGVGGFLGSVMFRKNHNNNNSSNKNESS